MADFETCMRRERAHVQQELRQKVERMRLNEAKSLFEGESCALSYNDDGDWFDDEDEEFVFDGSNMWFEEAFEEGMKEHEIMSRGYLDAKKRAG